MPRKASPEEKQIYDKIVMQALSFLHQKEQAFHIEKMVKQGQPGEAIATAAATALRQIMAAAGQAGHQLTMKYIAPAGGEIIKHLIEMMVQFGAIQKGQAQQVLQQAQAIFQQIVAGRQKQGV